MSLKRRSRSLIRRYAAAPPGIDGEQNLVARGHNQLVPPLVIRGHLDVGEWSTLGTQVRSFGDVTIGRYCQVAPLVAFYGNDHPSAHLTSYTNEKLFGGRMKEHRASAPIVIGNDVWVGHGALILKGVTIGDGAVVGAGAVVTHSIEPFEVVTGNPSRSVRRRFTPEICELVSEVRWWDLSPAELEGHEEVFAVDLAANPEEGVKLLRAWLEERAGP